MTQLVARVAALLCALGVTLACAPPIQTLRMQESATSGVTRIAVMPVVVSKRAPGKAEPLPEDAPAVVSSRVVEALTLWSGIEHVPPGSVENWVGSDAAAARPECKPDDTLCRERALARAFQVHALLHVTLHRFRRRQGSPASVQRPAAVWFDLELRTPTGTPLWRGVYDEEQPSLTADLGSLPRAIDRGFRWVTAERLTSDGAKLLVQALDAELRRWR